MLLHRSLVPTCALAAALAMAGATLSPAPAAPMRITRGTVSFPAQRGLQPDTGGHAVYVSDAIGKSVFRFVRNADGTLQTPASSSLVLSYNPFAIAIEGGNLYVTNQVNNAVEVYKARSTGYAPPKRSLLLPFEPTCVAVDQNGYEFVGGSTNGFVAVYAPKAKGMAQPIQEIALPDRHPTVNGCSVDDAGNLYVTDTNEVSEFATPTTNPTLVRAIIGAGEQNGPSGIAIDKTEEAYVVNTGSNDVLAYSPNANGTSPPDYVISSTTQPLSGPIGDAVKGNDLYVTSGNQATGNPAVFVFDKRKGAQKPIQIVTGPYLALPVGVAIGP